LFVTTIAKQIKEVDFPGCHLTWLIGSRYKQVILNNCFIDEILELPIFSREDIIKQRNAVKGYIYSNKMNDTYDNIFITDFTPENYINWYGTTRSSLFRSYPFKLKVHPEPIVYLTESEKLNVANFCNKHDLINNKVNVLFECSPESGQSVMSMHTAKKLAEEISSKNLMIKFILSSNQSFITDNLNIIDGSKLSWRENAELANYCQLLIGCSSGISWLCTSNSVKKIPFIQIINPNYMEGRISPSMKVDFMYFGLDTKSIIELLNPTYDRLKQCFLAFSQNSFEHAKKSYDMHNYKSFGNLDFLIESKIEMKLKWWLFFRYALRRKIFESYRKYKPKWFTPVRWIKEFQRIYIKEIYYNLIIIVIII